MVSKKSSKSYNSRSKDNVNHTDFKNVPKADSKSGAELLNIAPPINNVTQGTPTQSQTEPPKAPQTAQLNSSTSMFMDDIIHLDTTTQKPESRLPRILAIAICMIILIFWVTVVIISTHINFGPKMMDKNITYTSYVQINNSYADWVNPKTSHTLGEEFTQLGFLREEVLQVDPMTKTTGYYIVDDYNNKIKLQLGSSQQDNDYKKLFVINNNTKGTYNVSGTVDVNKGFIIIVTNITVQPKSLNTIKKVQVESVAVESSGIKFDLNSGWTTVNEMLFGKQKVEE